MSKINYIIGMLKNLNVKYVKKHLLQYCNCDYIPYKKSLKIYATFIVVKYLLSVKIRIQSLKDIL